jgi:hypothetical protein
MGGEGYISAQEILAYCDLTGVTSPDDRHSFFRAIRAMDITFLASRKERDDREKAAKPEKPRQRGRG